MGSSKVADLWPISCCSGGMKISCPHSHSDIRVPLDPKFSPIVRNGSFFRKSDSRHITRYFCRICKTYFSQATLRPFYFQKKRRITRDVYLLLNSGVSQRRAARLLRVNPKTVVRRFRLLSELERIRHKEWLRETYSTSKLKLTTSRTELLQSADPSP